MNKLQEVISKHGSFYKGYYDENDDFHENDECCSCKDVDDHTKAVAEEIINVLLKEVERTVPTGSAFQRIKEAFE